MIIITKETKTTQPTTQYKSTNFPVRLHKTTLTFSFRRRAIRSVRPDRVAYSSPVLRPLPAMPAVSASAQSYYCGTTLDFRSDIWYFVTALRRRAISNWLMLFLRPLELHLKRSEIKPTVLQFSHLLPNLMRLCLNRSANASSSRGSVSVSGCNPAAATAAAIAGWCDPGWPWCPGEIF